MRGKFITLEGGEGVGKTSNLETAVAALRNAELDVVRTREPGGTPLAEQVRQLLLDHREEEVHPTAELLLMFAARAQHISRVIEPALSAGQWVVCDRFTDATYAYQGGGRGSNTHDIAALERLVQGPLTPDLTIYLDVAPDVAHERIQNRSLDRIEREEQAFFARVRAVYLARAEQEDRFRVIDASRPLAQVQQTVARTVQEFVSAAT